MVVVVVSLFPFERLFVIVIDIVALVKRVNCLLVVLVVVVVVVSLFPFERLFVVIVIDVVALFIRVNCCCCCYWWFQRWFVVIVIDVVVLVKRVKCLLLVSLEQAAVFSCKTEDGGAVACCCRSRRWTGSLQLSGSGGMHDHLLQSNKSNTRAD